MFNSLRKYSTNKGIVDFTINGITETIIKKELYPLSKCQSILKDQQIAIIGYGPQGRGQALNLRDQNLNPIIGLRKSKSWDKALEDGFVEGKDLFSIDEASKRGTIIQYLLSDAAQIAKWPIIKKNLEPGKSLYFSHGFGITYNDKTDIVPPKNVDVMLVAPKGPGIYVRDNFLNGKGINSSWAIYQDFTGKAKDKCLAMAFAIGSNYVFETTFKNEVYSDLTGERSVLMGLIQGAFKAQYDVLRENGHSPSEAYNETVEEALISLYPLIRDNGMDWMYENCSTTAQRGALDWWPKFYEANKPIIQQCYEDVRSGKEAQITIDANNDPNYRKNLQKELNEMKDQELWKVASFLRTLRK